MLYKIFQTPAKTVYELDKGAKAASIPRQILYFQREKLEPCYQNANCFVSREEVQL